jgi:flagellar M-ring protein FliF
VLPDRPLFSRDKADASASIVLKVRGELEAQQVRAIRHLVATAVNGLKPERVSVVDETGRLLADGASTEGNLGIGLDERQLAFERRLREQIEGIVSSVVGPGRARVQVTADFDFNRVTQTSDKFDPEGRVVRSTQLREETSGTTTGQSGQVTVANELPGAKPQSPDGAQTRDQTRKSEEVVNYEISRTTKTEVIEGGRVNRISVAVLVDGSYGKDASGAAVYRAREKEEIDRIAALVRSAIGFDPKRGDQIEVVNLRFAEAPQGLVAEQSSWLSFLEFTKDDFMHGIELFVMILLGLVVLLLVVRPLVRRIITPDGTPALADRALAALPPNLQAAVTAAHRGEDIKALPSQTAKMIDVAQVQGQVHAQSVQKVGELADKNPNETVAIIRTWLHEPAAG